jgi:hypothetical protein
MAIQLSVAVRNARLDAIESAISTGPTLEIRTGAQPANCAAADSGSVLATFTLPSDWLAAAANGAKAIANGPWQDTSADAAGIAAHFRIKAGSTCHLQGTVGQGSGDLQIDNTNIAAGQTVSITTFTLTDANP